MKKREVIFSLLSMFFAVLILSFTIGRQLINGENPSLASFAIINFAGYFFLLLMPVETLIPYYQSLGHPSISLLIVAVFTAMLAQPINYAIGYLMSTEIIQKLVGENKFHKLHHYLINYGAMAIFFFNLLPLSSSLLSLIAGMFRYKLRNLMFFSFAGLMLKYIVLVYLFHGLV